jgi:uncharacterized membrane protein affecting hemolysin expression
MGVIDIRHSDLNSSVISVVLHCSPFTIHLLLSSSLFPMLYASFATDPPQAEPLTRSLMTQIALCLAPCALCL